MATNSVKVSDIKTSADSAATSYVQEAQEFLGVMKGIAQSSIDPNWTWQTPNLVDPLIAGDIYAAARNAPAQVSLPTDQSVRPSDPVFTAVSIPDFGNVPELILAEPIISMPAAPDATLPASPGNAPELNSAVLPVAPAITLPSPPTIQSLALPEAPSINVPVFSSNAPVDDLLEPTNNFSFSEEGYQSELLDAARIRLMDDLVNGGYGIETEDEQALWARARERELLNAETQIQEASRQAAARGMMMPPGALNATIAKIQAESLEKTSTLSRDVALKRADMYVENRKFTLQQVQQTEAMLIQYYGFAQERILNAAKLTAEFGVQAYNLKVTRFNARIEAFKSASQVYETQIRAALAHLDVYKAKVEGAKLSVETQQVYVQLYNAQLQGLHSTVELYRTQMEAAKVYTTVEMSKLDLFRSRVEAYQAQVGAKSAEFGMYESRMKGELAKVGLYEASVRAYATRVEAYKSGVAAKETIVRAQVAAASLPLEQYKAKIQMYNSDVARHNSNVSAALGLNESSIRRYTAQLGAVVEAVKTSASIGEHNANIVADQARVKVGAMSAQLSAIQSFDNLRASVANNGLKVLSDNATAIRTAASGLVAEIQSA